MDKPTKFLIALIVGLAVTVLVSQLAINQAYQDLKLRCEPMANRAGAHWIECPTDSNFNVK